MQILHADMAGGMGQSKIPFNCVTMVINCKPSHCQIVQLQAIVLENLVPYSTSKYLHCAYLKLHTICRAPWCADFSPLPVSYTKALKTERFAWAALVHESKGKWLTSLSCHKAKAEMNHKEYCSLAVTAHTEHGLFNVCNNMVNLIRYKLREFDTCPFYLPDTPVNMKLSHGHHNWQESVQVIEGQHQMKTGKTSYSWSENTNADH